MEARSQTQKRRVQPINRVSCGEQRVNLFNHLRSVDS